MQLGQNWARDGRQRGSSGGAGGQGFGGSSCRCKVPCLPCGTSVCPPMPEVLFLSGKGGNGGKTIRWCPAAHTATKDLVHLKTAPPTTLKSSCRYHWQLLAQSSSSQLLLPIMTLLSCQRWCACYLGQLGAVAASPPASHLSCLVSSSGCPVSSSGCPSAMLAGPGGAVGHLGLFPDTHQRLLAAWLRGDIGSFRPHSIPIIKLGHFYTKGHVVLRSIPFTPCSLRVLAHKIKQH